MYSHDVNYSYFLELIKRMRNSQSLRVLDYGCGNGDMVRYLRSNGVNCYGTDLFEALCSYTSINDLRLAGIVKPLASKGGVPFQMKFDLIISNQVFEHVHDLDTALSHIKRALTSDGIMHHHFPCQETIREGHIGIPFAHWFPKGQTRFIYTLLLRCLGWGYHKGDKSPLAWTEYKLKWIDEHCVYRNYTEILNLLTTKYGFEVNEREMDYIAFRCKERSLLHRIVSIHQLVNLYRYIFTRLGFRVIDVVPIGQGH